MANEYKGITNNAKIDKIDKDIIDFLLNNGRMPYSELAKKVGISRGMVSKRVENMQRKGIIEKFTVLVSREYTRKPLPVFFEIIVNPKYITKVAEKISTYDDIFVVYHMSGKSGLHVHGYFVDIDDVHKFIHNHINSLPGIQDISTEFLLKKFKSRLV
jgi:DNA-binding Lrp family transcriptional regulator